ncbi:hypothetical protein RIF29_18997 [Crotalaria pallida]|uniref:Uncharacterized protein n=1 Tax=Crotalaria pallida TaxID=3830 RepID=A0AAN9F2C2_CROPI
MVVGSMSFLVDFGSPNSSVVQNPGRLVSPPSVSILRTRSNYIRYNPAMLDNVAEFVSPKSSVIQNPGRLFTPPSVSNLRTWSDILNSKGYKSAINGTMETILSLSNLQSRSSQIFHSWVIAIMTCLEQMVDSKKGAVNVQGSQNPNVLSDITNISHSRGQSSIVSHITYLADDGVTYGSSNRNIKRRVSFSNDNRIAIPRTKQRTDNDSSRRPSATIGTAGVPSTPRRQSSKKKSRWRTC